MTDLVIRPLIAGEEELFLSMAESPLARVQSPDRDYRSLLAANQYRPEWTWVALRDGRTVARAAWWGGPTDAEPINLDWFDFDEVEVGADLLRAATPRTEYCVLLPPGWRQRPEVRRAGEARIDAAVRSGMSPLVERLRYEWTPANGLPDRSDRLRYRPEPDDEAILEVLRRIHSDTLDAHARRTITAHGLDAAAQEDLDFLRWCPSPREWWRLAHTPAGELVGLTVPARNHTAPVIGIIGVVPEQRGHGYGFDLLAEATHLLVEQGVERVVAETDKTNTPMARTFARADYPVIQERVYLT
jgi:RimJ/RimL family protein N-acetyltransferase